MKKKELFALAIVMFISVTSWASGSDEIIGKWNTQNKNSVVEVQFNEKTKMFEGKIISVSNEDKKDLIGKDILQDLQLDEEEKVYKGKLYIPRFRSYKDCTAKIDGDMLILKIFFGIGSKEVTWEREK